MLSSGIISRSVFSIRVLILGLRSVPTLILWSFSLPMLTMLSVCLVTGCCARALTSWSKYPGQLGGQGQDAQQRAHPQSVQARCGNDALRTAIPNHNI